MRSILLHSASLAVVNLVSIVLAYAGSRIVNPPDQTAFQVPVAFTLSCALFLAWILVAARAFPGSLSVDRPGFFVGIWVGALLLGPVGFALLVFALGGAWPRAGAWGAVAGYQLVTNSVAVPAAREVLRLRNRASR